MRCRLASNSPADKSALEELNIPYECVPGQRNPHAVDAAIREWQVIHSLTLLYSLGCRCIVDLYGSRRTVTIAERLNNDVFPKDEPLSILLHQEFKEQSDVGRVDEPSPPLAALLRQADGLYMNDVYYLNSDDLTHWCSKNKLKAFVWSGHEHPGVCGSQGHSGAWKRNEKNLVEARADLVNRSYIHPDANWLCAGGSYKGWTWTPEQCVLTRRIVLGKPVSVPSRPLRTKAYVKFAYRRIPAWYDEWPLLETAGAIGERFATKCWLLPETDRDRTYLLCPALRNVLENKARLGSVNAYVRNSLANVAANWSLEDPTAIRLRNAFSAHFVERIWQDTLTVFLLDYSYRDNRLMKDQMRASHRFYRTNNLRSQFASEVEYVSKWFSWLTVVLSYIALFSAIGAAFFGLFSFLFHVWFWFLVTAFTAILGLCLYSTMLILRRTLPKPWARLFKSPRHWAWEEYRHHVYVLGIPMHNSASCDEANPERCFIHSKEPDPCTAPQHPKRRMTTRNDHHVGVPLKEGQPGWWILLPCGVPMGRPSKSAATLASVVRTRVSLDTPRPEGMEFAEWKKEAKIHWHLALQASNATVPIGMPISWNDNVDEWIAHLRKPRQIKNMQRELERAKTKWFDLSEKEFTQVSVMVKMDEILLKQEAHNNLLSKLFMKPRAIANVHPRCQVYLQPFIYQAAQRLKLAWDGKRYHRIMYGRTPVYLSMYFASSASCEELSSWASRFESLPFQPGSMTVAIAIAGDDSLVCVEFNGNKWYWEGDAAMFDQSQGEPALMHEYALLCRLGVPNEVVHALLRLAKAPWVGFAKGSSNKTADDFSVRVNIEEPIRHTGGADTTLGNSLNMGGSWIYMVDRIGIDSDQDVLCDAFLRLGFKIKMARYTKLEDASFLKGSWHRTEYFAGCQYPHAYTWRPLPSRIIKLTKSLDDPRVIYKCGSDLRTAAASFLRDQALGMTNYADTPIFREFYYAFAHLKGVAPSASWVPPTFHVEADADVAREKLGPIVEPEVWENWARRYQISTDDLYEASQELHGARPFSVLRSRVWLSLAARDYA